MSSIRQTPSLLDQINANQTLLLVAVIVLVHLAGIALLIGCLWSQSPRHVPSYKLARTERELYKQNIAKLD